MPSWSNPEVTNRIVIIILRDSVFVVAQIVCGNRAGAATILLDEEGRSVEDIGLSGEQVPTFVAKSLHEVAVLLREKFELRGSDSFEQVAADVE